MDRLIAPNTVPTGSGDAAPATGTPGQATDGNPATNVPATRFPSYAFNAIQEELVAAILAGGLTLDRTNNGQLAAAIKAIAQKQISGVVGVARNLLILVPTAATSTTVTADEVITETALGGLRYCVKSLNAALDLTKTGIGGMDTGAAPANGAIAVYAATNPSTGASGVFAVNATSVLAPEVYGGANAPAGYTSTALVSILRTNASGQIIPCLARYRSVSIAAISLATFTTIPASPTALPISNVSPNVKSLSVASQTSTGANSAANFTLSASAGGIGGASYFAPIANSLNPDTKPVPLQSSASIYYSGTVTGSISCGLTYTGYTF
ncbi:hypothetical protein PCA20602_02742 [Pandoraea capi]|uniref:Phage tail protein n=1 Tax=Pandoraea capi TaxID=2508286 RepID=A0ABY6W364_9BURK|nr:hypothetical protein [Pandoraea capi]VVE13160.1 hypothetical protein PCA20602_02742 [Pandoraea capi]